MATSGVSNFSPLALIRKGEQVSTDSNHEVDEKVKDSAGPMEKKQKQSTTNLSNEEIFEKWCKCWRITYKDNTEKEKRFNIFLTRLRPSLEEKLKNVVNLPGIINYPCFADRTRQELDIYYDEYEVEDEDEGIEFTTFPLPFTCYVLESDINMLIEIDDRKLDFRPQDTRLVDRDIFDKWCTFFDKTYTEDEKNYRFNIFQTRLRPPFDQKYLPYVNLFGLADRTIEEMGFPPMRYYGFQDEIDMLIKAYERLMESDFDTKVTNSCQHCTHCKLEDV